MIWLTVGGWLPALLIIGWLVMLILCHHRLNAYLLIAFAVCLLVLLGGLLAGDLVGRLVDTPTGSVEHDLDGAGMSIMMWSAISSIAGLFSVVALLCLNGIVALVCAWRRETRRTAAQRRALPRSTSLLWATGGAVAAGAAVFTLVGYVWIGQVRESNSCEHASGRFVAAEDAGTVRYLIDGDLPARLTLKGRPTASGGSCPPIEADQPSDAVKPLTWSAVYGYPERSTPTKPRPWVPDPTNPDIIRMNLTVWNNGYPEQAPRSTQAPGRQALTINGQVAYLVHQSAGPGTQQPAVDILRWTIAPGIQAELTGQGDGVDGGIVALAKRVRPVTANDPRLIRSHPPTDQR
jgi:hypothetical protein